MTRRTAEETRTRILQTAAALFARNGYHATGIAELATAVGLGKGGLYHHIGSKEQLLFDITQRSISLLVRSAEAVLDSQESAADRLRALARDLMRNIADNLDGWTVFFREHDALTGERRDQVLASRDHYESLWERVLREGAANGEFVTVSALARKGLLGMFNYSYLWLRPSGQRTPEDIAEEFCRIVIGGLARP